MAYHMHAIDRSIPLRAGATIDVAPIINEELAKLGNPLPLGAGPASLDRRAREILHDDGNDRFTAEQYRRALRKAISELTDARDSLTKGSPNIAGRKDQTTLITARDLLDIRAREILTARGIYDETAEQYADALDEAQAQLEPDEDAQPAYTGSDTGDELHLAAMRVLRDQGKDWDYDDEDYIRAVAEAAPMLSINLNGRR